MNHLDADNSKWSIDEISLVKFWFDTWRPNQLVQLNQSTVWPISVHVRTCSVDDLANRLRSFLSFRWDLQMRSNFFISLYYSWTSWGYLIRLTISAISLRVRTEIIKYIIHQRYINEITNIQLHYSVWNLKEPTFSNSLCFNRFYQLFSSI